MLQIPVTYARQSVPAYRLRRSHAAFTLIELLVVIAIIAILAAILFPVFASARVSARKTACASNLRQIGMGIRMYADDFDGFMPHTTHTHSNTPEVCWIFTLRPYLGKVNEIRISPADPQAKDRLAEDGTSYVLNEYLVVPSNPNFAGDVAFLDLNSVPRSAETFLAFTISDEQAPTFVQDHTHSRNWFIRSDGRAWGRILSDIQPDRHRMGTPKGRTRSIEGSANYLYADGHVTAIPALRIKGWADTNFNFAKPPIN